MAENQEKALPTAPPGAPQRIKIGMTPLFSTWIYVCQDGPIHLNHRLELLTRRLKKDDRNAIKRTNYGGWHYAFDLLALTDEVIAEFRNQMVQHVQSYLNHFRPADRRKQDRFVLRGWVNVNRAGDFNILHSHPGCFVSAVYYVKVPPVMEGCEIFFRDPSGSVP